MVVAYVGGYADNINGTKSNYLKGGGCNLALNV
jgi:hypothetical protein